MKRFLCRFWILAALTATSSLGTKAQSLVESPAPVRKTETPQVPKKPWLAMSALVYTAVALDMRATADSVERKKKYPQYYLGFPESDPLARPFVKLPRPAYFACGLALATGINWVGYRMSKSPRFRKFWWLPQASSMAGNSVGYKMQRALN